MKNFANQIFDRVEILNSTTTTRGDVSYEFFSPSGDASNLIGEPG